MIDNNYSNSNGIDIDIDLIWAIDRRRRGLDTTTTPRYFSRDSNLN